MGQVRGTGAADVEWGYVLHGGRWEPGGLPELAPQVSDENANDEAADRSDAGPRRIGGPQGQAAERKCDLQEAGQRSDDRDGGSTPVREPVRLLGAVGPNHLQRAGHDDHEPGHR